VTVTVDISDVVANVLRRLKGEPLEKGLTLLIRDYVEAKIGECNAKAKGYESKYFGFERLKDKILNERHDWKEEKDLFDWEATLTEVQRLSEILAEIEEVEG